MEKSFLCAVICAVLFFALSPGVLLTLPPNCHGKVFMAMKKDTNGSSCCATSYEAAAVHALIFGILCYLVCYFLCMAK